jgi:putative spermidine/putrescine transport system ATP-binding protein
MVDSKLKIRDLRKSYGSVEAIANVNLDVSEGEFLTLLGPSGSGKTTLLMMVAGLTLPDSGEVWIEGQLSTYAPSSKRDIGMVFQNYALFPHMTVFENIAFPLRMRHVEESMIRSEVTKVLELVQLPAVAQRLPNELSGGQQQRIALARCMVYEPSIILMDEPLGALDKKLRDQMQLEIKQLHTRLGITVLYVTHDQEEAMIMSDKICLLNNARIEQIGTPADLYFRPRTAFAASFLGESNMFAVEVTDTHDDQHVMEMSSGAILRAPKRGDISSGNKVSAMVRPESVSLVPADQSVENVIEGKLKETIMAGGITKYYVEVANDQVFAVTTLTTRDSYQLAQSSTVRLGWNIEDTVILHNH